MMNFTNTIRAGCDAEWLAHEWVKWKIYSFPMYTPTYRQANEQVFDQIIPIRNIIKQEIK
jgi:hypothetical protein